MATKPPTSVYHEMVESVYLGAVPLHQHRSCCVSSTNSSCTWFYRKLWVCMGQKTRPMGQRSWPSLVLTICVFNGGTPNIWMLYSMENRGVPLFSSRWDLLLSDNGIPHHQAPKDGHSTALGNRSRTYHHGHRTDGHKESAVVVPTNLRAGIANCQETRDAGVFASKILNLPWNRWT